MYFKIKNKILFRNYGTYGYITDNAMFGYRMMNDKLYYPGEEYVSESGTVMLEMLSKYPRNIESIVNELLTIFVDVDYDEIKQDTIDFFMQFVDAGFLCYGETLNECIENDIDLEVEDEEGVIENEFLIEECGRNTINPNDFLRSLHIEIASKCNERCVHCYIPHKYKNRIIESELFYKIIEEGRKLNILNVTLSGGEPLLHRDIIGFLERCRQLDLSVNVLSNLTLLSNDMINEMKKNPLLSVQTSLYSMNPVIHDAITNKKGSFEITKNNILKLCAMKIPVQISCPVMKENKETYKSVIEWGNNNNIQVGTDFVIFADFDMNRNLDHRLSFEELEEVYNELSVDKAKHILEKVNEKQQLTCESPVCSVCRYYLCISAEGNVFPCVGWQSKIIGNLKREKLSDIWQNSEKINELRSIKLKQFEKCITCDDRGYCTICMMNNSNENVDGDEFRVTGFHCKVAEMIHKKVDMIINNNERF